MKRFSLTTAILGFSFNVLLTFGSFAADAPQAEPSASPSKAAPAAADKAKNPAAAESAKGGGRRDTEESTSKASVEKAASDAADKAKHPAAVESAKGGGRRDTMESTHKGSVEKAAPAAADTAKNPAAIESAKGGGRRDRDTEESTHKGSLNRTTPAEALNKQLLAHAAKSSATLSEPQKAMLLKVVNTGEIKTLTALLPSIDENKAAAIQAARPFKTVDDLILVKGMGETPFDGIVSTVKKDGPPPWITLSGKTLSEQKPPAPMQAFDKDLRSESELGK